MIGQGLMDLVGGITRSVFLTLVGVVSVVFIVRKEFIRLLEFGLLALVVATFVFWPGMWVSIARVVANAVGAPGSP
ncbi:MAG: hypothetical protein ACRDKW_02960 [Actinomycetota bacterium]|jgi:hypothetical protein